MPLRAEPKTAFQIGAVVIALFYDQMKYNVRGDLLVGAGGAEYGVEHGSSQEKAKHGQLYSSSQFRSSYSTTGCAL